MSSALAATAARKAVASFPDSDIEIALDFCMTCVPEFLTASNDRLVKVGRSLKSLVELADHYEKQQTEDDDNSKKVDFDLDASLEPIITECRLIASGKVKVPKVRFGKTELQMPIVTLGCMRFQQEWGPRITTMNMVRSDIQENLVQILKTAILEYGMNHIETARGYGCSELQLGVALKQLIMTGKVKREDLIIQSKLGAKEDPNEFRADLELSLKNLQVDYLDLFSIHGLNLPEAMKYIFEGEENCMTVIKEFVDAGKIRHVGFSTHAATDLIVKAIETDAFDYVNVHYHSIGSYTGTGGGSEGHGNLEAVRKAKERDMGVFIISPFDKGGALYAPSRKLRTLTLPEMEPMTYQCLWQFNHHLLETEGGDKLPELHTCTAGAGRPSDLDQPAVAAYLQATKPEECLAKVNKVRQRLEQAKIDALGKEWVDTWWKGLPKADQCRSCVEHNQIVWINNVLKAFGMYEFAKQRYKTFEDNLAKCDESLSNEENIEKKITKARWGYMPGLALKPDGEYDYDLINVPTNNRKKVKEAEEFVYKAIRNRELDKDPNAISLFGQQINVNTIAASVNSISASAQAFSMFASNLLGEEVEEPATAAAATTTSTSAEQEPDEFNIPWEWEIAYDMRPWPELPVFPSS